MAEIGDTIARIDLTRATALGEFLLLESKNIEVGRNLSEDMEIHIDERCCKILDSSKALSVLAALYDLVDKLHRDGLTCLVVLGIDSENLWLHCPMLIDL